MSRRPERKGLGKGLSALLGDVAAPTAEAPKQAGTSTVPIDLIRANPDQPRRHFPKDELEELAASIRERGVIQPVVLRPDPGRNGGYQLVAGERRWRAAQIAGVHELPAVVRDLDDREVLELAIIENVQRADLNPIEEAAAYQQLAHKFGYSQEELARVMGKSRSHIANALRLLNLPEPVLDMLRDGTLSAGHARALINAPDPVALARKAIAEGWSVRDVERHAREVTGRGNRRTAAPPPSSKDADTAALESDLSAAIGMRVAIGHDQKSGGGEVRIRYRTLEELDNLCQKLTD